MRIEPSTVRRLRKFDVAEPRDSAEQCGFEERRVAPLDSGRGQRLIAGGRWEATVLPRSEMQTTCCYALQDKTWVNDPDGNEWEVFAVLADNLSEEVQGAADKTCCVPSFTNIDGKPAEVATACC